jgi:raffinose/stachyose/melibiose transport system substrate-binding protein
MKKLVVGFLLLLLALTIIGCSGSTPDTPVDTRAEATAVPDTTAPDTTTDSTAAEPAEKVQVTILGTLKPEIADQVEAAIATYNESQDKYEVVSIPLDTNPVEKMTTLYASGNAPTIMGMGQEFAQFQENLLDLTDVAFSQHALPGTQEPVMVNGRVYGMPLTVEAFGLLYNKSALDEAVGGDFDPNSIQSRSDLQALMDQIAALEGKTAVHLSPMDWSLGAHVSNKMFSPQSADRAERLQFIEDLKAGTVSLMDNQVFNGWLDTFDLLKEYNANAASPLSPDYDQGTLALGSGDVGLWFMGNWAFPQLNEINPDTDYGILPYPVSDDPATYGNTQISVGVPFYMVIDASQSTEAEQQGAIDFLNWLVTDAAGQDYYINQFKFIPVFDTFTAKPEDSMSRQILSYVEEGRTLEWMNSLYPADGWPTMGVSMQKYLSDNIGREELAQEFEDYWQGVGN